VLYPVLMRMRSPQAREMVRAALEEHQVIDGLLAEIDQIEPDHPQFEARLIALRRSVERHVDAEEGVVFAQARIHLTDERLEALGREIAARRPNGAAVDSGSFSAAAEATGASGPARRADQGH
jgi:hypothetical protein